MNRRQKMIDATAAEWRELGFYYECDEIKWLFIGDKAGLGNFATLLREYVNEPNHAEVGHEHYGPYMYLEICTGTKPHVDEHSISGQVKDLLRLAALIEAKLAESICGDIFSIGTDYAPDAELQMEFQVREDGFDPVDLDPMDWADRV